MKDTKNFVKPDFDEELYRFVEIENEFKTLREHEQKLERPKRPFMVSSWEEYLEYVDKLEEYELETTRIKNCRLALQAERDTIENKLKGAIPEEIWFRSNDGLLAYGLEFHDWGGTKLRLVVRAWGSTLTSLDHRYHEA